MENELFQKFKSKSKVINLQKEYPGFTGKEKYCIVTEMTEQELVSEFDSIIAKYRPFIIIGMEFYRERKEFVKNEKKHKRQSKYSCNILDCPAITAEMQVTDIYFKEETLKETQKKEQILDKLHSIVFDLSLLSGRQKKHIQEHFYNGKSITIIAIEEGVSFVTVYKSINSALRKMAKYISYNIKNKEEL